MLSQWTQGNAIASECEGIQPTHLLLKLCEWAGRTFNGEGEKMEGPCVLECGCPPVSEGGIMQEFQMGRGIYHGQISKDLCNGGVKGH